MSDLVVGIAIVGGAVYLSALHMKLEKIQATLENLVDWADRQPVPPERPAEGPTYQLHGTDEDDAAAEAEWERQQAARRE